MRSCCGWMMPLSMISRNSSGLMMPDHGLDDHDDEEQAKIRR